MNTHYQLLDTYSHNILTYSRAHHAAEMLVLNVAIKLSFCTIFSPRSPCGHKPHLLDDIRVLTCKTSKAITNILKEHTTSIFMVYNFLTPIQDSRDGNPFLRSGTINAIHSSHMSEGLLDSEWGVQSCRCFQVQFVRPQDLLLLKFHEANQNFYPGVLASMYYWLRT